MIARAKQVCWSSSSRGAPTGGAFPAHNINGISSKKGPHPAAAAAAPTTTGSRRSRQTGPLKHCLGRLVEILYTQILVAIFVSFFFSIYRSSKIIFPTTVTTTPTSASSPEHPSSNSHPNNNKLSSSSSLSLEAQLRQEALERLAREAAQFEDDDNTNTNANNALGGAGGGKGGGGFGGDSTAAGSRTVGNKKRTGKGNNNNNDNGKGRVAANSDTTFQDYAEFLVQPDDFIYQKLPGEAAPIVLERFKLIFFAQAKVGCTVWKMLFRRMMGYKNWREAPLAHRPDINGLKYLYDYNISYASHIMKSPQWTRAVFIRDPKERFLSAYLDKAVEDHLFVDTCCNRVRQVYCNPVPPPIYEFLSAIRTCKDSHWDPQSSRMEDKYWPLINFVGRMETVQQDAKKLLLRLHAWEDFGTSGWGGKTQDKPIFATDDGVSHARNAKAKLQEYLYPELEKELEEFYNADYQSPWFQLSNSRKYHDGSSSSTSLVTPVDHATLERPLVEPRDWIYRKSHTEGESSPIVVEKYKLVFFAIPHVAENEFKRLFHRMMGHDDWKSRLFDRKRPNFVNEGLVYLRDYGLERASQIMTSPEWTRAIFVRDPKERFALAYTQTAIRRRLLLHQICCMKPPKLFCMKGTHTRDLLDVPTAPEFLKGIKTCKSTHWDPINERLGALTRLGVNSAQNKEFDPSIFVKNKYWKYINFVGNMDNAQRDAKALLERLGVWAEFGESGWADVSAEVTTGQDSFFGTTSFLKQELKAKKHVQKIITDPQMEGEIEKFYESDYMSPWFELPKKVLYATTGNTFGDVANILLSDVKKLQHESDGAQLREW